MFKTTPREYQQTIIENAYHSFLSYGYHAFLCEMGTGKTLMSLYAAELLFRAGYLDSILVIPPKMLISTWIKEIDKHSIISPDYFFWCNSKPIDHISESNKTPVIFVNVEKFSDDLWVGVKG